MAKTAKALCDRCDYKITIGEAFCGSCGGPTQWASHQERTDWEVAQWRKASKPQMSAPGQKNRRRWLVNPFGRKQEETPFLALVDASLDPPAAPASPEPTSMPETITLEPREYAFAAKPREVTRPALKPSPRQIRRTPAAKTATAVAGQKVEQKIQAKPRPEAVVAKVEPAVAPKPEPTSSVSPAPVDEEPLRDTPATVLAMRLLNARVAELDAKLQRLERELGELRGRN